MLRKRSAPPAGRTLSVILRPTDSSNIMVSNKQVFKTKRPVDHLADKSWLRRIVSGLLLLGLRRPGLRDLSLRPHGV